MRIRKRHIMGLFEGRELLQAGEVARALGVTRQTAHRHLRTMVAEGRLIMEGGGRSTRYRRAIPTDARRYPTGGLEEDRVWTDMSGSGSVIDGVPDLPKMVLHYALTELVNNAIEHSGAHEVVVEISLSHRSVGVRVLDLGVGIFRHIRNRMGLSTELEALQELSKGKTTTMPSRHTGEGIFFTSMAANRLEIRSGGLRWIVDNRRNDMAVGGIEPAEKGTDVRVQVDIDSARDLTAVFAEFTDAFEFNRTRTVIRLFAIGAEFVSRSQAKRLVNGLEKFRQVVLDFDGVRLVGQGFADEVFRVWGARHPGVELIPTAMIEPVAFMVERAIRAASEQQ